LGEGEGLLDSCGVVKSINDMIMEVKGAELGFEIDKKSVTG